MRHPEGSPSPVSRLTLPTSRIPARLRGDRVHDRREASGMAVSSLSQQSIGSVSPSEVLGQLARSLASMQISYMKETGWRFALGPDARQVASFLY